MRLRLLVCITALTLTPRMLFASFEPWIDDLKRCSAIIKDTDLSQAAAAAASKCSAPKAPLPPMQTINVEQLHAQIRKIDVKSDRPPAPKIKTFAEIEAEFAKKKSRLSLAVTFQNAFLNKLSLATNEVEKEYKRNPISDPSQHERITQELSDLMEEVNRFCEKKSANGDSGEITAQIHRVFSRPEYVYLLANSTFGNQVLNLPQGIAKNGKRYKQNSYQVCLNGEPPFRGHMRYRTKYLFNKEAIANAAKQIEKDIANNRVTIQKERATLKSCSVAPKQSVQMEKIDECMDQVELLLANDLTTYPNAYLSILKTEQSSRPLVCAGLMRAESEKIAKENLSNLFMAAGLVSIPLSIAIPGSGIALGMIAGALTFSESAVGVNQIIANNRKMAELDASLRAKMISQDGADKSKSKLQEDNTGQVIGLVTGVAGAAGDVVGLVKKGNQARKVANATEVASETVPPVKVQSKIEATTAQPEVSAAKVAPAKPHEAQTNPSDLKTFLHQEDEFKKLQTGLKEATDRSNRDLDHILKEIEDAPYPISEADIATYLKKIDRAIFEENRKIANEISPLLNQVRKKIRHPHTPADEIDGLKKIEQKYIEMQDVLKKTNEILVKRKVESMERIGAKLSNEFPLASKLPDENTHLGDHICPNPCDISHITEHLEKTKRTTGGQTTFFPPNLDRDSIWTMIKKNISAETKPSWQTTIVFEKSTDNSIKYWTKSRIIQIVDQAKNVNMKVRVIICAKQQGCVNEAKGINAKLGEPVTFFPECGDALQVWKNGQLTTGVPCTK